MSGESSVPKPELSNRRRRKFAPKKIQLPKDRISFRELAKFAARRKTQQFLTDCTGCDPSTAKRWLSGESRAPADAGFAVLADILARLG